MIIITNNMLSKINVIGICLILITVIFGNKFAPGRYCAYYEKDTIAEFGPTLSDENGKYGFWVQTPPSWIEGIVYLEAVGCYKNNKKEGLWVDFYYDSTCTKCEEKIYKDGIVVDSSKHFDINGILNEKRWHDGKGYLIGGLVRMPDGKFYDAPLVGTFSDERAELKKDSPINYRYVIFNSWSNIIDKTVATIAAILLIVNVIFFIKKKIA